MKMVSAQAQLVFLINLSISISFSLLALLSFLIWILMAVGLQGVIFLVTSCGRVLFQVNFL
jgi:hypothetical protein